MERKMKDSCIPWIGEIPEHWKIARIKDIYIVSKLVLLRPLKLRVFMMVIICGQTLETLMGRLYSRHLNI